ncbi:hypothetical protein STEG23_026952, partial [Scotinomys teguina]
GSSISCGTWHMLLQNASRGCFSVGHTPCSQDIQSGRRACIGEAYGPQPPLLVFSLKEVQRVICSF